MSKMGSYFLSIEETGNNPLNMPVTTPSDGQGEPYEDYEGVGKGLESKVSKGPKPDLHKTIDPIGLFERMNKII